MCQLKLLDKPIVRQLLIDYHLMVKVKMHMDQFADGMQQVNIVAAMKNNPHLFKLLFFYTDETISAGKDNYYNTIMTTMFKLCASGVI